MGAKAALAQAAGFPTLRYLRVSAMGLDFLKEPGRSWRPQGPVSPLHYPNLTPRREGHLPESWNSAPLSFVVISITQNGAWLSTDVC